MTTRSIDSTTSRRSRRERITNEDVYDYALRVAYLGHLMTPKVAASSDTKEKEREKELAKEHHSRLSGLSSSIYSIGDMFKDVGRDGPRSVKFPEKLLKVLDAKMQNIAMGRDPGYTDQLIRRTVAMFWSSLKDPAFLKQMKENRKIEELILMFVTTATAALKKDPSLAGDKWKIELNNQIAQFIRILRQCLGTITYVPPELTARLDMYTAKLVPSTPSETSSDSGSLTVVARSETPNSVLSPAASSISDMPLVQTVARLFGYTESEVQNDVASLKKTCTEKAALSDLKTCLKNINANAPFPGRREDFESEEAWQYWRTQELAHLSQLMLVMVQLKPEIAKSPPSEVPSSMPARPMSADFVRDASDDPTVSRRESTASRYSLAVPSSFDTETIGTSIQDDDDGSTGASFIFIPPHPKKFYKRLVELCIEYDLRAMSSLPEDQEVPLGILSLRHLEILNECAVRWRIGPSYRVSCFLDIIKYKYEREEVPLECIPEGLQIASKALHELELSKWTIDDAEYLTQVYGALFNIFLGLLYHALENFGSITQDDIYPYLSILEKIRESGLMERYDVDVTARVADIAKRIREIAIVQYNTKSKELANVHTGVNRAMPLLLLTDWIEKQAKSLDKRFPEPLLGNLDLVCLALESYHPLFLSDLEYSRRHLLEGSMNQPTPDVPIEDIFSLYRRTQTLTSMYTAFCPNPPEEFDIVSYFEPYVLQWLINTDNKTTQWVDSAIKVDKFEAEGPEGHSSSIIDLFESLKPPIDFLVDLKWPDAYQEARFFTALSKTINKAIEQYCRSVEELFMAEMYPRPPPEAQATKQIAWMEKAKLTMAGEKKVEPFNFLATSCIKLNNVEAARKLLDQMYARMDSDKVARTLDELAPALPPKGTPKERFLFTVKIVHAENLPPTDSSSKLDTFVTLSDEKGVRLAKTRTIYESLAPRWEETFDFSVENSLWLMASVRDRALVGKHDTVARAYLCLDPGRYGDFLTHDLWLDLDTQGRILIRVSMEGEKDDIQFYFGRAFRSLKRAEGDMTRIFIDKMSPLIQQSLSRNVLKTLIKTGVPATLDYNKALGNVKDFFGSKMGSNNSDVLIPLPHQEKPRIRPEQLTDMEIEQAISPLFDYFETNLQVLNSSLSDTARQTMMIRVWKEILLIIEGLLIPPLSDAYSDMKPLSDKEVDIVFKWLKFLRDYFYAGGEGPVPLEQLQNQKYRDVVSIRLYYDWHTDALMEECVRMMQQNLRGAPTLKKRAKSVYQQRNLGTIKDRKREKSKQAENSNGEVIMRILRMRPNTKDFIQQQLKIMSAMQSEQESRIKRRSVATRQPRLSPVPALPPLPE